MQFFREIVKEQYKEEPLEGPVRCDLHFYMPIPKSASKKKQAMMLNGEIRPTGTPDRTNLAKLYEDAIQGIVIKNDSQIVEGSVDKFYSGVPRTQIVVIEI